MWQHFCDCDKRAIGDGEVEWLRDRDDSIAEPKPFSSIPGLLRARRPELYEDLTKPAEDLFDYFNPQ